MLTRMNDQHPQPCVIFTASADKLFSEFDLESMPLKDTKLSIYFETEEVMEDTFVKLRYNCPDPDCEYFAGSGWNDLKAHIRGVHSKSLWYVTSISATHSLVV